MPKKIGEIKKVAVVGAGTMGSGIAQVVASSDREVLLVDISDPALDRGMQVIDKSLGRLVKKESITQEDSSSLMNRITRTTNFEDLGDVDFVIEAVFEDMAVKKEIYSKLDNITGDDVILATNTSSLPIVEIALGTSKADKLVTSTDVYPDLDKLFFPQHIFANF